MNDIDKAVAVLEGKCPECLVLLPKHTMDCPKNKLVRSLRQIATHLGHSIGVAKSTVEKADQGKLEDINDIIKELAKHNLEC